MGMSATIGTGELHYTGLLALVARRQGHSSSFGMLELTRDQVSRILEEMVAALQKGLSLYSSSSPAAGLSALARDAAAARDLQYWLEYSSGQLLFA
jgi:hypothetical protein